MYLHTMRRLIMILATRERKAARLIRERWLTKAILAKNSQRLRPVLEALLASVCKDKPDRLLDYATEWMRTSYPAQATEAAAADVVCSWHPRTDVDDTQEGLMSYLSQTNATAILEGIIERAISAQPDNVTAYVIDELVALNPDVLLPEPLSDEESEEDEVVEAEEEELLVEEEILMLEEEEALINEEEVGGDAEHDGGLGAQRGSGSVLALAKLEEVDEEDEEDEGLGWDGETQRL